MDDQMHLHGAAGKLGAGCLKGQPLHECKVEQVLIERLATAGDQ